MLTHTDKRSDLPVTARPTGARFVVETHGLHHRRVGETREGEDVSDNFFERDSGCFRALPTCRD